MDEARDRTFSFDFVASRQALEATVNGRIDDAAELIAMFTELLAEARRTGSSRLLVLDHTHGVVPPEAGLKQLAVALEGTGFDTMRLAYVDGRGTAISRMELAEIIGREHGYDCRVFGDESRARLWLDYGAQ